MTEARYSAGRTKPVLYMAGALSLLAATIHFLVTPKYFEEWWGYGTFMLVAAIAQASYVWFLLRHWPRWSLVLLAGIVCNLAIVGMWAWTRAFGIPVGASAGEVQRITPLDLTCTASEVALVVLLAWLFRLSLRQRRES